MSRFFKWFTFKKLFKISLIMLVIGAIVIVICNKWVVATTQDQIYSDVEDVPYNDVGLVLGTSKDGRYGTNLYFKYRMQAAAELYHAGKIKHVLVSGDNHREGYDEPTDMMDYLIDLGVPEDAITRDYAGFRTYDSMIRCNEIFGQSSVTIISQEFHNQRALFIANHREIEAVAFNARSVRSSTPKREYLARVAACLDLFVWGTDPHFLGKKEPIKV